MLGISSITSNAIVSTPTPLNRDAFKSFITTFIKSKEGELRDSMNSGPLKLTSINSVDMTFGPTTSEIKMDCDLTYRWDIGIARGDAKINGKLIATPIASSGGNIGVKVTNLDVNVDAGTLALIAAVGYYVPFVGGTYLSAMLLQAYFSLKNALNTTPIFFWADDTASKMNSFQITENNLASSISPYVFSVLNKNPIVINQTEPNTGIIINGTIQYDTFKLVSTDFNTGYFRFDIAASAKNFSYKIPSIATGSLPINCGLGVDLTLALFVDKSDNTLWAKCVSINNIRDLNSSLPSVVVNAVSALIGKYLPMQQIYPFKGLANQSNYITNLTLVADGNESVPAPSGYVKINYDINKGHGGDYLYLCQQNNPLNQTGAPVTDIVVLVLNHDVSSGDIPTGYKLISRDCNKNMGGAYVYICYTTDKSKGRPIDNVMIIHSTKPDMPAPIGYYKVPGDLKSGTGGEFVHVAYSRQSLLNWGKLQA